MTVCTICLDDGNIISDNISAIYYYLQETTWSVSVIRHFRYLRNLSSPRGGRDQIRSPTRFVSVRCPQMAGEIARIAAMRTVGGLYPRALEILAAPPPVTLMNPAFTNNRPIPGHCVCLMAESDATIYKPHPWSSQVDDSGPLMCRVFPPVR
ncbi:hypothetical protein ElyMa_002394400 [Elysia marginata]|uniref:Uncharacterized protein n=1 Tax=Elysia marginata TaxID=1093978 RepID=A0AAV4GCR3_9GAST|nr:hypothetical protein ElyMa_002394400 [Elysia marginata]